MAVGLEGSGVSEDRPDRKAPCLLRGRFVKPKVVRPCSGGGPVTAAADATKQLGPFDRPNAAAGLAVTYIVYARRSRFITTDYCGRRTVGRDTRHK